MTALGVLQVCAFNARGYETALSTSAGSTEVEGHIDDYRLLSNKQVHIRTATDWTKLDT